jgi:hypothetical protein
MSSPVDHIRVTLDGIGAETFLIFPLLDYIPHPHAQTKLDTVGHMEPRQTQAPRKLRFTGFAHLSADRESPEIGRAPFLLRRNEKRDRVVRAFGEADGSARDMTHIDCHHSGDRHSR